MPDVELPPLVEAAADPAPGDPTAAELAAVSAAIRAECGWHIAPEITQTIVLDSDGAATLMLPSLHVTAVSSVRNLAGADPVEVTDFRWSRAGMLQRPGGWPRGFRTVEVTLTHGFSERPDDLAALLRTLAKRTVASETIGSRTLQLDPVESIMTAEMLDLYRVAPAP
jgi:hypothetical protein